MKYLIKVNTIRSSIKHHEKTNKNEGNHIGGVICF